jgi:hypothetical protein
MRCVIFRKLGHVDVGRLKLGHVDVGRLKWNEARMWYPER